MNETAATKPVDTSLVKPTWITLIAAWVIILLPIPFTTPLGWIVSIGAAVMAIISLTRGVVGIAIAQLVCALLGTWFVSWIGWAIFGASVVGAALSAGG